MTSSGSVSRTLGHNVRSAVEAGLGDVISVNPGEVHDGAPIGDAPRTWRMLYLEPTVVAQNTEDHVKGTIGSTAPP